MRDSAVFLASILLILLLISPPTSSKENFQIFLSASDPNRLQSEFKFHISVFDISHCSLSAFYGYSLFAIQWILCLNYYFIFVSAILSIVRLTIVSKQNKTFLYFWKNRDFYKFRKLELPKNQHFRSPQTFSFQLLVNIVFFRTISTKF